MVMSTRDWGPWGLNEHGHLVVSGPAGCVVFTESGVVGVGGESDTVQWGHVRSVGVQVPTMSLRNWRAARFFGWLVPEVIVLDGPEILVGVIGTAAPHHREWNLGLPERPFSAATRRATEALNETLEHEGAVRLLGDRERGPALLDLALSSYPPDRFFINTRIGRAVSTALRTNTT